MAINNYTFPPGENLWDRTGSTLVPHNANDNIDLGSGDFTSTGTITGGDLTLTLGSNQDYDFNGRSQTLYIQGMSSGVSSYLELFTNDGDSTDDAGFRIYGLGTPSDVGNRERLIMESNGSTTFDIYGEVGGTGALRPIRLYASGVNSQFVLGTGGNVGLSTATPLTTLHLTGSSASTPSGTNSIVAGTGITTAMITANEHVRVEGSGGAVTVTATPSIAPGLTDGQKITIQGTSDTNTLTLQPEAVLPSSTLKMEGGVSFTLGVDDYIKFRWNSVTSIWGETSRSNNS